MSILEGAFLGLVQGFKSAYSIHHLGAIVTFGDLHCHSMFQWHAADVRNLSFGRIIV